MATINPNQNVTANTGVDVEQLLDKIADKLIVDPSVNPSLVASNQKTIRNGLVQLGRDLNEDTLLLYQKDVKANEEDFNANYIEDASGINGITALTYIASNLPTNVNAITIDIGHHPTSGKIDSILVSSALNGGASYELFDILVDLETGNPLNISQFVSISRQKTIIDPEQANEYLDTNIYELLPTGDTRQARIIRFFNELNTLLPSEIPQFDITGSAEQGPDGRVDRTSDGNWIGEQEYDKRYSIAYSQNNTDGFIEEEEAFIHRIKNQNTNDTNESRTIEDIYNIIRPYLDDVLEEELSLQDNRPIYRNKADGYLQFRNLNQSIIIRNTNQEFVDGLDPNNPTWLDTGFTITMWVRFLDKSSSGTLFNFGNPTRIENPFGFKLETFVNDEKSKRYLRLIVLDDRNIVESYTCTEHSTTPGAVCDPDNNTCVDELGAPHPCLLTQNISSYWYDSHIGSGNSYKVRTESIYSLDVPSNNQFIDVPIDFTEWYFICATYDTSIDELNSDINNTVPEYWANHIDSGGNFISNSGLGNRSKIEIISRTDLLRARGFKV